MKKSTYCLLLHSSDLHLHMDDSRVQRGAFLASSVVNPGMVVTFPGYCSLANLGMCLCWQVPYLCQQASSPSTEKTEKNPNTFNPVCKVNDKSYRFMMIWGQWMETVPDGCLMDAWQLPDDCLMTAWQLPDDCLMTAWQLPDNCLTVVCLTTA